MDGKNGIFIVKAMFFETYTPKHKPILVKGREFYSLTYRYSGRAVISVDGTELVSEADSITFMPKGLSYTTEVTEDVRMATVHFDFECERPPVKPVVIHIENTSVPSLFGALMKNGGDTSADFSKMSIFYEILASLDALEKMASKKNMPKKIARAKEIIDSEYRDPYFSIVSVSERLGISTAYLRREFRAAFGSSPIGYLKELRIKRAKFLLLTRQNSVSAVAEECGYSCPSYFIQDFHKIMGESPGSYRRRLIDSP